MKGLRLFSKLAALVLLSASVAQAADVTPPAPITPMATEVTINNDATSQRDTHISGTLVSYTDDANYDIHYYNFATGQGGSVPKPAGAYDSLSDVNGNIIALTRLGSGKSAIYTFDVSAPNVDPREIAPQSTTTIRRNPAIGNGTIAWEDQSFGGSGFPSEIVVYDIASGSTLRITNDQLEDRFPALSSDGSTIVWAKHGTSNTWDVWQATRTDNWMPKQLTGGANQPNGEEWYPETNGTIVVYDSIRNGQNEIYWQPIGGGPESKLVLTGYQYDPHIFGDLISFDAKADANARADIYVYDLSTELLYKLTDTPEDEMHNDISIGPDGKVYVSWARQKQVSPYDLDIYGLSFARQSRPSLTVQPAFDQTRSYKLGSVVPIKLQITNAQGSNVSSSSLVVHATGVKQKDSTAGPLIVESAGVANPDSDFRYDATLSGYIYNLSTKNLSVGTWELQFTVGNDAATYRVVFDLR